jgi:RsiW-degrading membrane proteinase PrsW (M82 family)
MRKWYILAPVIAITGGFFGIVTAAAEEIKYIGYFGPFIAAPVIEEAIKPAGVYFLLTKKPAALRNQRYTAFLSAMAGLSFGIIESLMYVAFVSTQETVKNWQLFVIWRFTICLLLHTGCSFIAGYGINQQLTDSIKGEIPFLKGNWRYFLTAMSIHALYNVTVTVLTFLNLMPI